MDRLLKTIGFWSLVILAVLFFYKFLQSPATAPDLMDSIRFADALRAGKIASVALPRDATIGGELSERAADGKPARFLIAAPAYKDLVDDLLRQRVSVEVVTARESTPLVTILSWLPMLVLIGIWIFFMRTMQQSARRRQDAQPGSPITP